MLTLETANHMLTDDDVDATPDYDIRGKSWRARKRAHASVSIGQVFCWDWQTFTRWTGWDLNHTASQQVLRLFFRGS